MGFLDIFKKPSEKREDTALLNPSEMISDVLLKSLLSGETIDINKAMSIPSVASAVDRISSLIAMLPIYLYEEKITEDGNKKVTKVSNDSRVALLNQDTGDTLDPYQLKKSIVRDYLTNKGAYIYIEKNKNDFLSLRYVDPNSLSIFKNYHPIFKDIQYMVHDKKYEQYEFITVLRNTKDGATGTSAIDEISKSIETAYTTILYELGLVQKGGGKKGFLQSTKKLSNDAITELKNAWKNYYGNSTENVIILNEGLEFKEGASTSVELQMNERKKTLKEDIYDVFHIFATYDETIKNAVMPIISAIESALNRMLLLETEKGSFYFAFDTKKITRGNIKERYEAYKIASDTGWLGTNEIRYIEDLDAIDGLDVIKMNLANVLYDVKSKKFYTPNTGALTKIDSSNVEGGDNNEI